MSDSYTNTNARADTLNQAAAHDTGIYDPNIHDNQIVAMYETEARARAARDTLISNGVPERAVQVTNNEQDRSFGDPDYQRSESGLWGALKNLFMPNEEAHGYAEGVRRGHAILVVHPDTTMDRHGLVELLESTDPVDFDAKLEEWRQAGYSYPTTIGTGTAAVGATGAAMGTPTGTGMSTDTSAMRATDTTAAGTFRDAPSSSARESGSIGGGQRDDLSGNAYSSRDESGRDDFGRTTATPPATSTTLPDTVQRTRATTSAATAIGQDETIKIIEERLQVGKREVVKGAVRVRSYVVERPVEQQVRLHEERVEVERQPVDRPANAADDTLFRERVIEARATAEEAVIGKEARVVEEVGLRKEATDRTETVRDTVRKTEIEIEGEPSTAGYARDAARPAGTAATTAGASSSSRNAPQK
jgi:uncharacterized protein (TIGR02271 family)